MWLNLNTFVSDDSRALANKIIRRHIFVHAFMALVKITLVHAAPETLVNAQVTDFARVAKDKTKACLPGSFTSVWIQRMSVWTRNSYIGVVELFESLAAL